MQVVLLLPVRPGSLQSAGTDAFSAAGEETWMAPPGRNPSTLLMPSTAGGWSTAPECCPATAALETCPRCPSWQGPALHSCCSPVYSQTLLSHLQKGTHITLQPELPELAQTPTYPWLTASFTRNTLGFLRHTVQGHLPPSYFTKNRSSKKKTVNMHSQKSNPESQDLWRIFQFSEAPEVSPVLWLFKNSYCYRILL